MNTMIANGGVFDVHVCVWMYMYTSVYSVCDTSRFGCENLSQEFEPWQTMVMVPTMDQVCKPFDCIKKTDTQNITRKHQSLTTSTPKQNEINEKKKYM